MHPYQPRHAIPFGPSVPPLFSITNDFCQADSYPNLDETIWVTLVWKVQPLSLLICQLEQWGQLVTHFQKVPSGKES